VPTGGVVVPTGRVVVPTGRVVVPIGRVVVPTGRYKDLLRACPHHGFTELHQLDTFYNALIPADQDSLNAAAGGNLLERRSGSLPSNTVANPKGELKAITTHSEETFTDPDLIEYTIMVPPPPVQKYKPLSQREFVMHRRDPLHLNIPYPSSMLKQKQQEKDEVQIQKFWQLFKQLHINITLADALIFMPKYQKMLKALLSNKEKLQELANTPLNENCSAVILKKLPEKLRDLRKFLISCGFSELKCKALANLGASINLMPLSVWKKLGLPKLIPTRMTLELANRAICTPAGIARDVFVPVGKFTFPANLVIVDYESDPIVPLILGRPFLRTARALIDVHGEEMILRDGDERLTLNMRHDTSSYSNQPQKESINLINVFNISSEYFLEDLFPSQPSGNPTFSPHPELTSSEDSIDQKNLANFVDIFVDSIPEMFTDEHTLDYSSPPIFDEYEDDFLEGELDARNVYDDPFDSKGEKIKESKLLIDELDLPCDFHPPSEYDSFISQDFSRVDALPSTNNRTRYVTQLTPPYTSQHNGVSERRNHTLLDMVQSMMNLTTLSLSFWDYALESATCILNMVPTKNVDMTPRDVELEEIQDEDTSPSENTSEIPMQVEGFEPPQEEVIPNPGEPHWTIVKTILKYLRNTKDMFLVYGGNHKAELRVDCYCNAGFETDRDDIKSQTGYVFILNGGAVVQKSSKQSTTVMSTIEAEYIAASEATMEAVWIRKFISELDNNLADPFTKALPKGKLTQHARSM
nr:reverse transcriptase domain-containing protein [Tanacetum cinerariifolium]